LQDILTLTIHVIGPTERVYFAYANFLENLLCHGILRSGAQWYNPLLWMNILLLEHVLLKYYESANDSKSLDQTTRRFLLNVMTNMLLTSLRIQFSTLIPSIVKQGFISSEIIRKKWYFYKFVFINIQFVISLSSLLVKIYFVLFNKS